jgi:hypothetical protein
MTHTTRSGSAARATHAGSATRRRRAATAADGVIAAYIRELSHAAAPKPVETRPANACAS